jgi:hypothetical protein
LSDKPEQPDAITYEVSIIDEDPGPEPHASALWRGD